METNMELMDIFKKATIVSEIHHRYQKIFFYSNILIVLLLNVSDVFYTKNFESVIVSISILCSILSFLSVHWIGSDPSHRDWGGALSIMLKDYLNHFVDWIYKIDNKEREVNVFFTDLENQFVMVDRLYKSERVLNSDPENLKYFQESRNNLIELLKLKLYLLFCNNYNEILKLTSPIENVIDEKSTLHPYYIWLEHCHLNNKKISHIQNEA